MLMEMMMVVAAIPFNLLYHIAATTYREHLHKKNNEKYRQLTQTKERKSGSFTCTTPN